MQIILGTANLLSNYGIKYITKCVNELDTLDIIGKAQQLGIKRIDTAPSYSNVEKFLGSNIKNINTLEIDSKISLAVQFNEDEFMNEVYSSLENLGIRNLKTLYLHNLNPLLDSNLETTKKCLNVILKEGLAENVGVSVYSEEDIRFCLDRYNDFRSFQIPENICDRRFINSEYLFKLSELGIELNIRSIFLQGLLLADPESIPSYLRSATNSLVKFQEFALESKSNKFRMCVAYTKEIQWASNVVVSVGSSDELELITRVEEKLPRDYFKNIPELPEILKDPRNWKK